MKVLNLYAGIGGNRKLWEDVEVTAIEHNENIAKIYQDFFPNDNVIVCDAHKYLLEHYKEFDFIWSSPPCPTHSRFNFINVQQGMDPRYPDMKLYEEIIFLKNWFKGKFCVENVITYYKPLIKPIESNNHYFWTNFYFTSLKNTKRGIRRQEHNFRMQRIGFDLSNYNFDKIFEKQIINNCVEPELGLHIFECAFKEKQQLLNNPPPKKEVIS